MARSMIYPLIFAFMEILYDEMPEELTDSGTIIFVPLLNEVAFMS